MKNSIFALLMIVVALTGLSFPQLNGAQIDTSILVNLDFQSFTSFQILSAHLLSYIVTWNQEILLGLACIMLISSIVTQPNKKIERAFALKLEELRAKISSIENSFRQAQETLSKLKRENQTLVNKNTNLTKFLFSAESKIRELEALRDAAELGLGNSEGKQEEDKKVSNN